MRFRLKGATRAAIHDLGGIEVAARILNLSTAQVGRYQHQGADDFISIANAALLESQDGVEPHITRALAALNGNTLVQVPKADTAGKWSAGIAAAMKETGDLLSGFGAALADGEINREEAQRLLIEADQAMSALASLRDQLQRQADALPAPLGRETPG